METSLFIHSKELAQLSREKREEGKTLLYKTLYTFAVILRLFEVVSVILFPVIIIWVVSFAF